MTTLLNSLPGMLVSLVTIAGLIVLVALHDATLAEALPLIGVLAGGHLVAGATPTLAPTAAAAPAPSAAAAPASPVVQ